MNKKWPKLHPKNWFRKENEETLTPQSGVKLLIIEVIKLGVFAIITIFLVRYFLFKPFYVRGASMEPTFFDHEYLIIDEISYRLRAPTRGEVVVLRNPQNSKEFFLKRIVGLPGERVKIKDGQVIVFNQNSPEGAILKENYLPLGLISRPDVNVNLSANQYFVMGDNRNSSFDSRFFGPVKENELIGRVWLRGWPFTRLQVFSAPLYPAL